MSTKLKELTETLIWRELIQQVPSLKWSRLARTPEPHTQYLLFNRLDKTQPLHRNHLVFQEILPADPKPPLDEKTLCFAVQLNPPPLVTSGTIITANQIHGQIPVHLTYRVEDPVQLIMAADDALQDWVEYLHRLIQELAKNQLDTEITVAGLEQELIEVINNNNSKEKWPQETGLIIEQITLIEPIEWNTEKTEVAPNAITSEATKEESPEQPPQPSPPAPTQIAPPTDKERDLNPGLTQIDTPPTDEEKELNPAPTQIDNPSIDKERDLNEMTAYSLNEQAQNLQAQRQALEEKEQALIAQAQELQEKAQALEQREQILKIREQALQQQQQQLVEQTLPGSPPYTKATEEDEENQRETDNAPNEYDDYEEDDYEPYEHKRNIIPFIIIILVIMMTIGISIFYFPTESAHFFRQLWERMGGG